MSPCRELFLIIFALSVFLPEIFAGSIAQAPEHNSVPQKITFSIPRVRRGNFTRDGVAAKARIFQRMGWPQSRDSAKQPGFLRFERVSHEGKIAAHQISTGHVAPTQQSGTASVTAMETSAVSESTAQPTATGSLNSLPQSHYSEYMSEILVGNQVMQVDLDTGSSDLWLFSTLLPEEQRIGHKYIFDPLESLSFRNLSGLTWRIEYGDNSAAEGVVGQDTVTLGGVSVPGQSIELATSVTPEFTRDSVNDGLIGMGFSNINNVEPVRQRTLFDNLRLILAQPLFVANLLDDGSGTYDFGYVNSSLLQPGKSFTTLPVNPRKGFWQFPSHGYSVGGNFTNRGLATSPAIVDSGTSLLLVDPVVVRDYWRRVPGAMYSENYQGWIFPCNMKLPNFGIAIGKVTSTGGNTSAGTVIQIAGWMLSYARLNQTYCYGALQSNDGYGTQVYG